MVALGIPSSGKLVGVGEELLKVGVGETDVIGDVVRFSSDLTLSIGTPYLITILVLKFEIVDSTTKLLFYVWQTV